MASETWCEILSHPEIEPRKSQNDFTFSKNVSANFRNTKSLDVYERLMVLQATAKHGTVWRGGNRKDI